MSSDSLPDTYPTASLEPYGGNLYRPHKFMVDSGTFWRCKHGMTGFGKNEAWGGCSECAKADPVAFARWHQLEARADSAVPSSHVHPSALSDRGSGEGVRAPGGTTERWKLFTHDLASMLVFGGFMPADAQDDPEGYDNYRTMEKVGYFCDLLNARIREAVCAEPAPTTASAPANSETDHPKAEGESILREALARLVRAVEVVVHGDANGESTETDFIEFNDAMVAARSALAGMPK